MRYVIKRRSVRVGVAAAVIIVAHYTGLLSWAENGVWRLLNPAAGALFHLGTSLASTYRDTSDSRSLQATNEALEQRINELLSVNISQQLLVEENEALREQLGFYTRTAYRKQLAHGVSRVSDTAGARVITLDVGSLNGVSVGNAVVSGSGLVVGKIASVSEHISHACLLTETTCHLAASVAGAKGLSGLTQGELGLTIRLDFVPQTESLAIGATVITSGLEPGIPAGLIIGTVQAIRNEDNNLFQTAVITPAADMNHTSIVSVIIQ